MNRKKFFCVVALIASFTMCMAKKVVYIERGATPDFNAPVCRDNLLKPFVDLQVALKNLGCEVKATLGLNNFEDAEAIICFEVKPCHRKLEGYPKEKCFLFLWEPPTVNPSNYEKKNHRYFSRVYTWQDDLVDNKKYFKFFDPTPTFELIDDLVPFEEKKNFVLLTRDIKRPHPLSLTPERRKIVKFFENNYKGNFDLYGISWPKNCSKNYRGPTPTKVGCFKHYKFSFCYENMRDINGYITGEKVFHTMRAGCVPIFWGAKNVETFIPRNCFIDRRNFCSYDHLCRFLEYITKDEYQVYLDNIKEYLKSPQAHLFSPELFIDIVISAIDPNYDKAIALTEKQRLRLENIKDYLKENPINGL